MSQTAGELIQHILDRFHDPLRSEIAALDEILQSETQDETITALRDAFGMLADELLPHMLKEEHVLFPHIAEMEGMVASGRPWRSSMGGLTPGVVSMMMREHGSARLGLVSLRRVTNDFTNPAPGRAELYARLAKFEEEMDRHIALEDDVLFPKALELERTLRASEWNHGHGRPA
jgi:regulator of cell morphogenesis and NO signaling